jgi:hydrogenase maturation protease
VNRILVAGIGNIFLADDGFGVEVARRLLSVELPAGVKVADFGIRGLHLAYELADYETAILLDATPRGAAPGTVYVLELDPADIPAPPTVEEVMERGAVLDAHGMAPAEVLALVSVLGGTPGRVLVVGCEPAELEERMGLSARVEAAVETALTQVHELIAVELSKLEGASRVPGNTW